MLCRTETPSDTERSNRLMAALDRINRTRGRGAVHYAGVRLGSSGDCGCN